MAFLPKEEQDQLISSFTFEKQTDATITTASAFRRELKEAKVNGLRVRPR